MSWQLKDVNFRIENRLSAKFFFLPLLIGITISLLPIVALSQTTNQKKEQLQTQMKKLQREIKQIEAALKTTAARKQKSMGEILSLQAQIRKREKLIGNINNQINDLDETIGATTHEIFDKSAEVERMKKDYALMLQKSYQNISLQNEVVFLFSSSSFYDGIRRYNYLLKVAEYRKQQAKSIQTAIVELEVKKGTLEEDKIEKQTLLKKQTSQKQTLETEKKQKNAAVSQLLEKEKKLKKSQEEKNKAIAQLNARIKAIIEEEIKQARLKAEEEAKRKGITTKDVSIKKGTAETMPLTPAEQALSKDFLNNQGKLPWPVVRGHVVSQFGKHEHPLLKGVVVENNGVDIKTEAGADVRSVFGGNVVSVFYLPTTQNCVIVKHGEFFTVYSNIETVTVKPGETISTKQTLGKLHTEKNEDLTKIHLEIWRGKDKMDPEQWLTN